MAHLHIDADTCTGCGACIAACPFAALSAAGTGDAPLVGASCTLCGACIDACPVDAISIAEAAAAGPAPVDRGACRDVWVWGEHHAGCFHPVVNELVGVARELAAQRGCRVRVVATTGGEEACASALQRQLRGRGVDTLHLCEHPGLALHRDGAVAQALADLLREHRPEIVLAGATGRGRAMIPRLAILLDTGLTADCTGLAIDDDGDLVQTRPAFGGNIMAAIVTRRHRPQMATVRPKVFAAPEPIDTAVPTLARHPASEQPPTDPVALLRPASGTQAEAVSIADAEVLVAGGRGLGGAEGFATLNELAELLGGQLAASRAAVDAGWAPYRLQVGQTGKTVHPRLYVAVGVAGAVQHTVGMSSAQTVVAINADPHAPIFSVADYGLVGDWQPIVERWCNALREERS